MLSVITGSLLALSAGLNAYVPLLALGLLARFTPIISLPQSWEWVTSTPALLIVGILLLLEILVDKVPALDTVNDVIQTAVRPASGGIVLSAGSTSTTWQITDPEVFTNVSAWWPFLIGVVVALIPHLVKSLVRPVLNTVTAGAGAAVVSTVEDVSAVVVSLAAIIVPVVGLVLALVIGLFVISRIRKARSRKRDRASGLKGTSS